MEVRIKDLPPILQRALTALDCRKQAVEVRFEDTWDPDVGPAIIVDLALDQWKAKLYDREGAVPGDIPINQNEVIIIAGTRRLFAHPALRNKITKEVQV